MSSNLDLLSVLEQIKNLETSFLSILMESALRLDALLGANVFLLVETSEGRRIAGSESLCRRFVDNDLRHDLTDVRVRLNDGVCSTTEEPSAPPSFSVDSLYRNCGPFATPEPMVSLGKKKKKRGTVSGAGSLGSFETFSPDIKKFRLDAEPSPGVGLDESSIDDGRFPILTLDDDAVVALNDDDAGPVRVGDFDGGVDLGVDAIGLAPTASFPFLHDYVETNPKISALMGKDSSEVVMDKGSFDLKLLSSVVYDIGKLMGEFALVSGMSEAETRESVGACFDAFWSTVPWLEEVNGKGFRVNNKKQKTLRTYLRDQFSTAVCRVKQNKTFG